MMAAGRRFPVVVILGATGTGKSKLAIELGQRFNGEIISADSMQTQYFVGICRSRMTMELRSRESWFQGTGLGKRNKGDELLPMQRVPPLHVTDVVQGKGKGPYSLATVGVAGVCRALLKNTQFFKIYKGLDIITNKVTAEDQAQCPHHLLSVLDPLSTNKTVVDFRNMALPIMEKLLDENKLPIIVGGTNYYIEALLWNFLIDKETAELAIQADDNSGTGQPPLSEHTGHAGADARADTHPTLTRPEKDSVNSSCNHSHSPKCQNKAVEMSSRTEIKVAEESEEDDDDGGLDEKGSEPAGASGKQSSKARQEKEEQYAGFESADLHSMLQKVDPKSARRLHPKNRRKIIRALQVYDNYGVPMSQIHQTQHITGNTPGLSGALRFPHCCVFWLQTQQDVLDDRLDRRVDDMLHNGLVSELHSLHSHYLESVAAQNGEPDYTLGIFQSIGFKEFHGYLTLPVDERETSEGKALLQKGVEGLKLATRQYARRQLKWIKNRFLKRAGVHVPVVYSLDSTDPTQWLTDVFQPATDILSAIMAGTRVPVEPISPDDTPGTIHVHNICQVCDGRVFTTLQEWQAHLGSRKHKKMLQHKQNKEKAELERQHLPEMAEDISNTS